MPGKRHLNYFHTRTPEMFRTMYRQFDLVFFRSCCSHKHMTVGDFLLEMLFPTGYVREAEQGDGYQEHTEARNAGMTQWKLFSFLYNMLRAANEAPLLSLYAYCVYPSISTIAGNERKAANSPAQWPQMVCNIYWHVRTLSHLLMFPEILQHSRMGNLCKKQILQILHSHMPPLCNISERFQDSSACCESSFSYVYVVEETSKVTTR